MDTALPDSELAAVKAALDSHLNDGIEFHALRTRQSGARRFVSLHVLVPGVWTVHRGHELLEDLEARIRAAVPNVTVFTHLESLDDPASETSAVDARPPRKRRTLNRAFGRSVTPWDDHAPGTSRRTPRLVRAPGSIAPAAMR
jgi:hypothetical protein